MFARFAQSWSLIKASASVLRSDKELLLFPLLSAIASMVVAASFIVPAVLGGAVTTLGDGGHVSPTLYLGLFAFYVVQYFVIIFFNTALVGAAMIRLRGGDPTVADGFRIALSKLPAILGYAVISATVGVLLRALQERAGFIGRYVVGLIGLAWTVASFLVVPVLANHDVGPIDAVKRSAELLKKTWGEPDRQHRHRPRVRLHRVRHRTRRRWPHRARRDNQDGRADRGGGAAGRGRRADAGACAGGVAGHLLGCAVPLCG